MSSHSAAVADRRRVAAARASSMRRHPTGRSGARAQTLGPPPTTYYVIALVVSIFVMLGLVMVLSASSIQDFHRGLSPWHLFSRQLIWALIGTCSLVICARIPYRSWRRVVTPLLGVSMALMVAPFLPGIGAEVNGAKSWIAVGSITFQPSELLKLALLLYTADVLTKRESEMHDLRRSLVPVLLVALVGAGMCAVQGDLGSAIVVGAIVFAVAFVGGAPFTPMLGAGVMATAGALLFVVTSPRRIHRFTSFLDIVGNRKYLSYQQYQAWIAIAQGGTTGAGPGRGLTKLGDFLPLAQSDFIFAVIAEELGLVGVVAVLGGFVVLAYCGVQVALAAPERFGMLLAGGITTWLVVQALINVGGVAGVMPVTGLTLPFFSAGGSSLCICMTAAGMLLNVARNAK